MLKTNFTIYIVLAIILGTAGCSRDQLDPKVEKAQKLIKVERYEDAIRILDEAILDDPTNPMIHYLLGQSYLAIGQDTQAEKTFSVLVQKLDASYGAQVVKLYHDKGDLYRAAEFDTDRKKLAHEHLASGKAAFRQGDLEVALLSFQSATTLVPSLVTEAYCPLEPDQKK